MASTPDIYKDNFYRFGDPDSSLDDDEMDELDFDIENPDLDEDANELDTGTYNSQWDE